MTSRLHLSRYWIWKNNICGISNQTAEMPRANRYASGIGVHMITTPACSRFSHQTPLFDTGVQIAHSDLDTSRGPSAASLLLLRRLLWFVRVRSALWRRRIGQSTAHRRAQNPARSSSRVGRALESKYLDHPLIPYLPVICLTVHRHDDFAILRYPEGSLVGEQTVSDMHRLLTGEKASTNNPRRKKLLTLRGK